MDLPNPGNGTGPALYADFLNKNQGITISLVDKSEKEKKKKKGGNATKCTVVMT